ncbi:MAG: excinuclease ABC subunit UvrA [Flavobacteriales bacterium]|nr:excinuclease ABC subunit UvrA [Flavobacteriales bacterium]MCB9192035.1 excinuclease ABC subunit UvrA [Flavobacteriales bacterium]
MSETIQAEDSFLEVNGARVHNLKDIDVRIPRDKLVVITGLSGSGKSSLAFDTIYAEGQRRYIETFASYARQFLGTLERPDVDNITGLSPVIAIEQKSTNRSPRSTVGTVTEIYDLVRLLYARASTAYSYNTGEKMVKYSDEEIIRIIREDMMDKKVLILAPVVKGRKGHYRELFVQVQRQGFQKVRVDGEVLDIDSKIKLDRYKVHDIEIVIDRLKVDDKSTKRLSDSVQIAMKHGKGSMMTMDHETEEVRFFSRALMCPTTGIAYDEPAPNFFSFNSPYGACNNCNGLGTVAEISVDKIIPNRKLSIARGAISPIGEAKGNWIFRQLEAIGDKYDFTLKTPVSDISDEALNVILYGSSEVFKVKEANSNSSAYSLSFEGIVNFISRQAEDASSNALQKWAASFTQLKTCPTCNGARLKKEALHFKFLDKSIADISALDLQELQSWFGVLKNELDERQSIIALEIIKEIQTRIQFLLDVGLDYLSLDRPARSLSGGEAQRIRLATQIGSQLVGVLYILDEPSIGLHQRDNQRLIDALKKLRDSGNSVIVVEHDKDMMVAADHVIDIGPKAGVLGGQIVAQGSAQELLAKDSLTASFLNGSFLIPPKTTFRKGNGKNLVIKGADGNNLQNVDATFPLGKFICVTGVSGSGKSTLINETLYPVLNREIFKAQKIPMPHKKVVGIEHLDKVIAIDQSPIGRTPRSNPATYTGVFSDIRNLFTMVPEAQIRGYKPGRFSFNVKGGRCEECQGAGLKTIEMNFLPDVHIQCTTCNGNRYNRETLEVRYKGKSISDVLDMNIDEAVEFFENIPSILKKIQTIQDVGLGYIKLGQSSTTLSGGEAQRIKLASELSKRDTGNTFYILDEPTTGLHFEDVRVLLEVLNRLVDKGNTVLVIEHNLDIIRSADHIIDLGPEGGKRGGEIVVEGTPKQVAKSGKGHTAKFLKLELEALGML